MCYPTGCCIWSGFLEQEGDFPRSRGGKKKGGGGVARRQSHVRRAKSEYWACPPLREPDQHPPVHPSTPPSPPLLWCVGSLKAPSLEKCIWQEQGGTVLKKQGGADLHCNSCFQCASFLPLRRSPQRADLLIPIFGSNDGCQASLHVKITKMVT